MSQRQQARKPAQRGRRRRRRRRRRRARGGNGIVPQEAGAQVTSNRTSSGGIGSQIGSTLGNWAEKGIKSLFGFGDYSEEQQENVIEAVEENSLLKPETSTAVPLLNSIDLKDGHVRIKHREFITDVTTQTTWATVGVRINPTNSAAFPWIAGMAGNFQQWIPHGIVYEFVSTSGSAVGANTALGSVSMATVYDAQNTDPFANKMELLNTVNAVSTKPSCNLLHGVECDPSETVQRVLFTSKKVGAAPGDNGPSWYILGVFNIATVGSQVPLPGFICGELWVTYDISLLKPKVETVGPQLKDWDQLHLESWLQSRAKVIAQREHRAIDLMDLKFTQNDRMLFLKYCEKETKEEEVLEEVLDDLVEGELGQPSGNWFPVHHEGHGIRPEVLRRWQLSRQRLQLQHAPEKGDA